MSSIQQVLAGYGASGTAYLLDGITSTVWAAYSTTKLYTAYAGSAIRVKDVADAEEDIGFDGNGLLDVAALSGNTPYRVITIYDQSGNARNASSSPTPFGIGVTLRLDVANKNLRFADCWYTLPDMSALTAGEIFVAKTDDADPAATGTGLWDFSLTAHSPYVPFSDSNVYDDWGSTARKNASFNTGGVMDTRNVYSVWSVANDWGQWLNGALKFSTVTNSVLFSATPILGRVGGSSGDPFYTGNLDTQVIFSEKVTADERIYLHANM